MTVSPCPVPSVAAPALELRAVRLRRGGAVLFDGLDLRLGESRIGLIGHNGAGKSSLLRLLCGLDLPDGGQVLLHGQDMHAPQAARAFGQRVGLMFQNPDDQIIFPTVREELALSLMPQGLKRRAALEQACAFLAQRGLAAWAERPVTALSQGQRQHLCWLALLLAGPGTLLLDEPYASLDLPGRARLEADIDTCAQQVIVSTHILEPVRDYPRVLWIEAGRVRADGPGRQVCAEYEATVAREVAQMRAACGTRSLYAA